MKEVKSPCIGLCQKDSKGLCFGCQRTNEEIGKWSSYTNEEKEAILKIRVNRKHVPGENPNAFLR